MRGYFPFPAKRGCAAARLPFILFVVCVIAPAIAAEAQPRDIARRVVIISCDGLRPDAIDQADTPSMKRLIETGSYTPICQAQFPCITLPNHSSMLTGLTIPHHGVTLNVKLEGRIDKTTVFDVAAKAGVSIGFFHNKDKLGYLCPEEQADVWRFSPDVDLLAELVVAAIEAEDLRLMFIHFGEPDGAGHKEGWMSDAYLAQVARDDRAIGSILNALDRKGILDETVVIITADHGGHDKTHFLPLPFDQNIPWIANGPGIAAGRRLETAVNTVDTAATVLHILGLPTTSAADGKVVDAAFVEPQPKQGPGAAAEPAAGQARGCAPFVWLALIVVPVIALLAWKGRERKPVVR